MMVLFFVEWLLSFLIAWIPWYEINKEPEEEVNTYFKLKI
jgi:hypothetical protein